VFLTHVGPIALSHAKRFARGRSRTRPSGAKRGVTPSKPFVEHVIALDYEKSQPSAFAKALATWTSRAAAYLPARKAG
jgi:hypothetical protein